MAEMVGKNAGEEPMRAKEEEEKELPNAVVNGRTEGEKARTPI